MRAVLRLSQRRLANYTQYRRGVLAPMQIIFKSTLSKSNVPSNETFAVLSSGFIEGSEEAAAAGVEQQQLQQQQHQGELPLDGQMQHSNSSDIDMTSLLDWKPYPGPLVNGKFTEEHKFMKTKKQKDAAKAATAVAGSADAHTEQQKNLLQTLNCIPERVQETQNKALEDETFEEEAAAAAARSGLYVRQIRIEEEQMQEAVQSYTKTLNQMLEMGRGTGLKYIQRILLKWYEPFTQVLVKEIGMIKSKTHAQDRQIYGPLLLLLPVEKLVVLTINTTLNTILKTGNIGVNIGNLARRIGDLVEIEVNVIKMKMSKKDLPPWSKNLLSDAFVPSKSTSTLGKKVRELVDQEAWSQKLKAKLGGALISMLIRSAKKEALDGDGNSEPAFIHTNDFYATLGKRLGILRLDSDLFKKIAEKELHHVMPRYLPMLVPPKAWNNKSKSGCYFRLKTNLMRTYSRAQNEALRRADMGGILEGLDYMGQIPWKINKPVFKILQEAWQSGLRLGELPPSTNVPMPRPSDCYRIPEKRTSFATRPSNLEDYAKVAKDFNVTSIAGADMKDKIGVDVEAIRESDKLVEKGGPVFDEQLFSEMCRRATLKNAELHSIRCDVQIKFWVAEKFEEDNIYFPYNLDFRGRAYPVPPNLSHLGSDLCRGILTFANAKPLGPQGFKWMKVHLANLFGNNKISHDERAKWTDEHFDKVRDSAKNPINGDKWWNTAEEPFQALATCFELVAAEESGNPETYKCSLPIHQDGSCNGLQHYAALGRDEPGAKAVNLTPSEQPQDVYSAVLDIVLRKMDQDTLIAEDEPDEHLRKKGIYARMTRGIVNRKVIKQTVMTSVYGVTKIGARAQVQARLEDKFFSDPTTVQTPEIDREIFGASRYIAFLTLESLQEMFKGASGIMNWLSTCASLVAQEGHVMSWVTPMGLPVMQPYRKSATQTVKTLMQSITLSVDDDTLPVSIKKQRTAFPPNFVHSLDATHMLMTSLRMKEKGLDFASVHDSYWTHACDVPVLNEVLRDCFVELYQGEILEQLRTSLVMRFPEVSFPPVPDGGTLNIEDVKKSAYFFH